MTNYDALDALGRERLSASFFMRDFLYSEIANWHRLRNVPQFPAHALRVGRSLCTELLEPLQERFGRIHVRSGYRSPDVNAFGNLNKLNCASNEKNFSAHIWDFPDRDGRYGATACIVIPVLVDYLAQGGKWTAMAWWIHDHLPYSSMCFFAQLGAFNLGWHENPARRIDSHAAPKGCLTKPGMAGSAGLHAEEYADLVAFAQAKSDVIKTPATLRMAVQHPSSTLSEPVVSKEFTPHMPTPCKTSNGTRPVQYRAVHTRNGWRKANHASLENAIFGNAGASGLFSGKIKTDYALHGKPLYAIVWQDGDTQGQIVRPDPTGRTGVEVVEIPMADIEIMENNRGCSLDDLGKYFIAAMLDPLRRP